MANNKIQLGDGTVLLDLTGDTVTTSKLKRGETAHDASGAPIVGTMDSGGEFVVELTADHSGEETVYTATHDGETITIAEIVGAHDAGATVVCRVAKPLDETYILDYACNLAQTISTGTGNISFVCFGGNATTEPSSDNAAIVAVQGYNVGGNDMWSVSLIETSAPLKLTASAAQSDPEKFDFTGATAEEIYNAFVEARSVIAQATFDDASGFTNDHYVLQMELSLAVRHANPSDQTSALYSFEFKAFNSTSLSIVGFTGIAANANPTNGVAQDYTLTPINP